MSRRIIDLLFFLSWSLGITHALFFADILVFTADLTLLLSSVVSLAPFSLLATEFSFFAVVVVLVEGRE